MFDFQLDQQSVDGGVHACLHCSRSDHYVVPNVIGQLIRSHESWKLTEVGPGSGFETFRPLDTSLLCELHRASQIDLIILGFCGTFGSLVVRAGAKC